MKEIIDEKSFVVDEEIDEGGALLYGSAPADFARLNKSAVFTLATAALQEVDRQLQAEKAKTAALQGEVSALAARLTQLEARFSEAAA